MSAAVMPSHNFQFSNTIDAFSSVGGPRNFDPSIVLPSMGAFFDLWIGPLSRQQSLNEFAKAKFRRKEVKKHGNSD